MSYYESLYNEPLRYSPPPRSYRRSSSPPPLEDDYLGWGRTTSYSPNRRMAGTEHWSADGTTYQYRSPGLNEYQYNSVDGEEQMYERRVEEPGHSEYFFESTKRTTSPSRVAPSRPSIYGPPAPSPLRPSSPTLGGGLGMGTSSPSIGGMGMNSSPMSGLGNTAYGLGTTTGFGQSGLGTSGYQPGLSGFRPTTPPPVGLGSSGMGPGMGMSSPTAHGLGLNSPNLGGMGHMNTMSGSPSYGMGPSSPSLGLGSPLSAGASGYGVGGYGPGGYNRGRDLSPSYRNYDAYESDFDTLRRRSYSPPPLLDEYEEIEEYTRTTTTTYY